MKLDSINGTRDLAELLRKEIDAFVGRDVPTEFCDLVREILHSDRCLRLLYGVGIQYRATVKTVLGEERLKMLNQVIIEVRNEK